MIMISLVPSSLVERTSDRTASSSITVPKFLIMSTSAWARPLFSLCLGVPVLPVSGVIAPGAWPGRPAARASGQDQAHGGGRDRRVQELERAGFVVEPVGREVITVLAGHDNVPAVRRDDEIPGALPHVGCDPDLR